MKTKRLIRLRETEKQVLSQVVSICLAEAKALRERADKAQLKFAQTGQPRHLDQAARLLHNEKMIQFLYHRFQETITEKERV